MFGRKKSDENSNGEPAPSSKRVSTEDSVLDELSRAFGAADHQKEGQEVAPDDNAAMIADDDSMEQGRVDPHSGLPDETVGELIHAEAGEPVKPLIVIADGDGLPEIKRAMDVSERKTIRLGDEADDWTIEVAPVVEAVERADQGNEVRNAVFTGRGPAADRTTIAIGGDDVLSISMATSMAVIRAPSSLMTMGPATLSVSRTQPRQESSHVSARGE
jgi:hypothetical protein